MDDSCCATCAAKHAELVARIEQLETFSAALAMTIKDVVIGPDAMKQQVFEAALMRNHRLMIEEGQRFKDADPARRS